MGYTTIANQIYDVWRQSVEANQRFVITLADESRNVSCFIHRMSTRGIIASLESRTRGTLPLRKCSFPAGNLGTECRSAARNMKQAKRRVLRIYAAFFVKVFFDRLSNRTPSLSAQSREPFDDCQAFPVNNGITRVGIRPL